MSNDAHQDVRECALIVLRDGGPQKVLAHFLRLTLNYQFGLSVVERDELAGAAKLVSTHREVRCVFVIRSQPVEREALAFLNRRGEIPLFFVLPQRNLDRQRQICGEMDRIFYGSWEKAFVHGEGSLRRIVSSALEAEGLGDLFLDADRFPYAELQRRVKQRLRGLDTLPTLPEIVLRIMRMVNDPRTTAEQLDHLLCQDPAIVMKLLQVVKSPAFSAVGRRSGWTLSEIIVRLGLKKVGAIAQQIKLINSLVRPEESDFDLLRFWEHSVGCAVIADRLHERRMVRIERRIEFDEYWIGALLHDIGKLVLGFFFKDWFSRILSRMKQTGESFRRAEISLGDVANHECIGRLLAINAGLDEDLADLVGSHHTLPEEPGPLVCLIHLADQLCKDLGMGYDEEERGVYDNRVLSELRIDQEDLQSIQKALSDVPDLVRNMVEQCL